MNIDTVASELELTDLTHSQYLKRSPGADPGFQVRGGAHLKKSRRVELGAKILGYFVWKITISRKKNHIFSNFRGGRRVHPPGSAPDHKSKLQLSSIPKLFYIPTTRHDCCVKSRIFFYTNHWLMFYYSQDVKSTYQFSNKLKLRILFLLVCPHFVARSYVWHKCVTFY